MKSIELNPLEGYSEAHVGKNFVLFSDASSQKLCLDEFDLPAVEEAFAMAKKFLPLLPSFPVFNDYGVQYVPGTDPLAKEAFLGLPPLSGKSWEDERDIGLLTIRGDLKARKEEVGTTIYAHQGKAWYTAEFRTYLLGRGLYFPFENEEEFLSYDRNQMPVFIDESRLSGHLKEAYEGFSVDRLLIDVLSREADSKHERFFRRFQGFSLSELVLYFLDDAEDERLDELVSDDVDENDDFAEVLREFLLDLVQVGRDDYRRERLQEELESCSYLLPQAVKGTERLCLSSFTAEMYGKEGEDFFLDETARERIRFLLEESLAEDPAMPLSVLYARLGLPYQGYVQLRRKEGVTTKNVLSHLDFAPDLVPDTIDFAAPKRVDIGRVDCFGSEEHLECYLTRRLLDEGVDLVSVPDESGEDLYAIMVHPSRRRNPELRKIFDAPQCALMDYYLPYCVKRDIPQDAKLEDVLRRLDEKSEGTACHAFFSTFAGCGVLDAVTFLQQRFRVRFPVEEAVDFFDYLFHRLLESVREELSAQLREEGRRDLLALLELSAQENFRYEPKLPSPYVTTSPYAVCFQKTPLDPPHFCSCQKEGLRKAIEHFRTNFSLKEKGNPSLEKENAYILSQLCLPQKVTQELDLKKEILPQLCFEDGLCHLCNGVTPIGGEGSDMNLEDSRVEAYLPYIRSIGAKNGVYLPLDPLSSLTAEELETKALLNSFSSLFPGDMGKISPAIDDFLQLPIQACAAILGLYDNDFLVSDEGMRAVASLRPYDSHFTYSAVLSSDEHTREILSVSPELFSRLSRFYQCLAYAYAIDCARKEIPGLASTTYVRTVPVKGLKHPRVVPGFVFNAFQDEEDGPYYFCSCDRTAMERTLIYFARSYDSRIEDPLILTSVVLSNAGFPLPFILDCLKRNVSLDQSNVPFFLSQLNFEDHLCGSCNRLLTPVPAFGEPFRYQISETEVSAARMRNEMAHAGFLLPLSFDWRDISYDSSYRYDLSSVMDPKVPFYYTLTYENDYFLSEFLGGNEDLLRTEIEDFLEETADEAGRKAIELIQEKRKDEKDFLYRLMDQLGTEGSYENTLRKEFPELKERKDREDVMQRILGFLTFLGERIDLHYKDYASVGGRRSS